MSATIALNIPADQPGGPIILVGADSCATIGNATYTGSDKSAHRKDWTFVCVGKGAFSSWLRIAAPDPEDDEGDEVYLLRLVGAAVEHGIRMKWDSTSWSAYAACPRGVWAIFPDGSLELVRGVQGSGNGDAVVAAYHAAVTMGANPEQAARVALESVARVYVHANADVRFWRKDKEAISNSL